MSPVTPPKRFSSRGAVTASLLRKSQSDHDILNAVRDHNNSEPLTETASKAEPSRLRSDSARSQCTFQGVGNAVSTNDDVAMPLRTIPLPALPVDLSDVPEEDEEASRADAPFQDDCLKTQASLRHAQTFPSARTSLSRTSYSTAESNINVYKPYKFGNSRRSAQSQSQSRSSSSPVISMKPCSIAHSSFLLDDWEQDIDYCYEHAAEARCDFDWSHDLDDNGNISASPDNSLIPDTLNLSTPELETAPELDPSSAYTSFTADQPPTPSIGGDTVEHDGEGLSWMRECSSKLNSALDMHQSFLAVPASKHVSHPSSSTSDIESLICRDDYALGLPFDRESHDSILLSLATSILNTTRSSRSSASLPEIKWPINKSRDSSLIPLRLSTVLPDAARSSVFNNNSLQSCSIDAAQEGYLARHRSLSLQAHRAFNRSYSLFPSNSTSRLEV